MKVLIINYQRITLPIRLAEWVAKRGLEPVFLDNNSDYPPLLEYYKTSPYQIVRMDKNYGHTVVWGQNILGRLGIKGSYIVTDPDLDLTGIPDDFLSVLEEGLRRYTYTDKCGFSLKIDDLPVHGTSEWEMQFWQRPLDSMYFDAAVDTTFALYREGVRHYSCCAVRTNKPYEARHLPWYYDQVKDLPEDEQYYFNTQTENIAAHSNVKGRTKR